MAYGIQTLRADQSVIMDGATVGGVFLEVLTIPAGTSSSKTYPRSVGGTLFAYTLVAGSHALTFDTNAANGQGRINWSSADSSSGNPYDTVVAVFAKKLTTIDSFGMEYLNDVGEVLLDTHYPVPQYLGKVSLTASGTPTYNPAGYVVYQFSSSPASIAALGSSTNRIAMIAMPDSGAADVWYTMDNPYLPAGSSGAVGIQVYAPYSVSFEVPQLFVYSLDKPPSAGAGFGLTVGDGVATSYNSSSENLNVSTYATIDAPANGAAATVISASFPLKAAVALPSFQRMQAGTQGTDAYTLVYKRVGNGQLQYKMMYSSHGQSQVFAGFERGTRVNGYFAILNISALGYSPTTYTPSGTPYGPPTITQHPASTGTLSEGSTATFTCAATGNPAPTYQWLKNGGAITGASVSNGTLSFVVGANDFTNDSYRCQVANSQGFVLSSPGYITVSHPAPATPPVFSQQPQNITCGINQTNVQFFTTVAPATSAQWYRNGVAVPGATGASHNPDNSVAGSFSYYVVAYNGGYSTQSNTVTLTVTSAPPVISLQPVSNSCPRADSGQAPLFQCNASPVTETHWLRDGVDMGSYGNVYYPPYNVVGTWTIQAVCYNGTTTTYSNQVTFTVTGGGGSGGGSGPYPQYATMPDYYDEQYDTTVELDVLGDDTWHIGTGDYTLYDVKLTISSCSPAQPFSGIANQRDIWYSFTGSGYQSWVLKQPTNYKSGLGTYVQGQIHIRLRSTGQEVSVSNYLLSSTNS